MDGNTTNATSAAPSTPVQTGGAEPQATNAGGYEQAGMSSGTEQQPAMNQQELQGTNITEGQATESNGQDMSTPTQMNEGEGQQEDPKDINEAFTLISEDNARRASEAISQADNNEQTSPKQRIDNAEGSKDQINGEGNRSSDSTTTVQGTDNGRSNEQQVNQQSGNDPNRNYAVAQEQYERQLTEQIKQRAYNDAVNELIDRKILERDANGNIKRLSLQDLQYVDEQNERIMWRNPYAKNEPFTTMKEAADHVDYYNQQVDKELQTIAKQRMQEYTKRATPSVELRKFASVYNQMKPEEKAVAQILTQDKAILGGADGKQVVGFNIDYSNLVKQSKAIVELITGLSNGSIKETANGGYERTNAAATPSNNTQANEQTTPALDAKTTNSTPSNEIKPEDIKEGDYTMAFKYLAQEDAKKREKGL